MIFTQYSQLRYKTLSEVELKHFLKAAKEIGTHGDNDTLPFDLDNKFIKESYDKLAEIAWKFYQKQSKSGRKQAAKVIDELDIFHERLLTPSGSSGFRITTKIHPFWNIYINGLAIAIAEKLEPFRSRTAHSYRYSNEPDRFFRRESSWYAYKEATLEEELLNYDSTVVVQTDVSGFYEHVYHHRLENLTGDLFGAHNTVAVQMDRILNQMSSGRSFGLPVGGQCSRVLAEVLMNAIDGLLDNSGVKWHRYVDDYTLIAANQSEAYKALSLLSKYLSDYGLSLNRTKTTFLSSSHYKNFVSAQLHSNDDQAGKLKEIDLYFDPYSDDPHAEYEELQKTVSELDIAGLLQAETTKSQPDSFLVAQISRTLEFQDPIAASQLCRTLLQPNNLNAFRASWSKVMRGIAKTRADDSFSVIHPTIDSCLDIVITESEHLLQPEANCLHFLRAIRFLKSNVRASFVSRIFDTSEYITVRRACIDCWRHWKDRASFISTSNSYHNFLPELQRMLWVASYTFGDEGKHFRNRVKKKIGSNWQLDFESGDAPTFSSIFCDWSSQCDF